MIWVKPTGTKPEPSQRNAPILEIHCTWTIMWFQGVLLLYDITSQASFEMLDYWLESIDQVRTSFPSTHWGRVTHICVSKLTIIGSDNGLAPGRRQTIIWTNDGILLIGPLGTIFSEILIGIQTISFKKMHLKMSSAKWRPFCLGLQLFTL